MLRGKNCKKKIIVLGILLIMIFSIIFTIMGKNIYFGQSMSNADIQYSKGYIEWEKLSEEERKNTLKPREEYISLEEVYRKETIIPDNEQKAQGYTYKSSEIPTSFNLKDKIGDIKVENQMPYNTCYAYAALNAVETNLALRTGNMYDFSEMHVEYMTSTLFGGSRQLESGGNFGTVISYLGNGYGPVLESDVPTKTYSEAEYSILTNAIQIARATYATAFSTIDKKNENYTEDELATVRNAVKNHIMNNGSVFAGLYMEESSNYYNLDTYAYCCLDGNMQMNHAVSIVGWDDNYPKENFPEQSRPSNNGAYIALNSWGENWGDNGYFYISYEDVWIEYNMSGIAETEELGPEIEFSGYSKTANKISVEVDVTDTGKSGVDETSLKYIWKNSGEVPSKSEFTNSFENGERISIDTSEDLTLWVLAKNNKEVTTISKEEITLVAGPWDISATEDDSVTANFYSDGTLVISGTGNMLDWKSMNDVPWVNNRKEIIKVIIEEGITNIGNNSFYSNYRDYAIKEVKMSDTIQKIGQFSFCGCGQLAEIDIPDNIQTIDLHAFSSCDNLQIVKLGKGVQRIEEMAFAFCKNLTVINLPEGLKYIGLDALRDNAIEEITIPSTVDTIKPRALIGAKTIIVKEDNAYYSSVEGHLFNKEGTTLVEYASGNTTTEYMIPDVVTKIGSFAFYKCENLITIKMNDNVEYIEISAFEYCTSIKNIEIPDGVTKIGREAFSNCTSLEEISIGINVKSIGESAFEKCENLKRINVAEGNLSYTSDNGILFNGDMTSLILSPSGNQLEEYTIPESVITVENSAFYNNQNLKVINLSDNLLTIPKNAFENCVNLLKVTNLNNVEEIGEYAFYKCSMLTTIENTENLKSIGHNAFNGCSSIETIELPEGMTRLEGQTFYKCTSLKDIKLPNTITSIGNYVFSYTPIENIDLPDNLLELGCAFSECTNLKEIVIPDTLSEIDSFTFENCSSLTNVELSNTIKKIGSSAFDGCSSIKNINIPDGVETIGCYAFANCSSLENIDIPDTVKEIDYDVFYNCESLKDVKLSKNLNILGDNIFYQCAMLQNVIIPSGIEEISFGMFGYCSNLETIDIPSTVKKIGEGAFYECTGITEVTIPEGVETLEKGAFYHCTNLNKITIPDTVTTITEYNFIGSENLTIYCKEGSTAHKYAIDNSINYVLMTDECINHVEIIDIAVEATCTEPGLTEGKHCSKCKEILIIQEEIPALGHNYETTVTAPTCTEQGYTTHACSRCQDTYVDTYTDASGHNYENGTCTNCGEKEPILEITTEKYDIQDSYISKIQINTTVGKIKENLTTNATEVKIYNKYNQIQDDTNILATGMRIEFNFNNKTYTYTVVVNGDIDGDGKVKFTDMSKLNKHRLKKTTLEGAYFLAADVTGDGRLDFMDLVKINKFRLNKITEL